MLRCFHVFRLSNSLKPNPIRGLRRSGEIVHIVVLGWGSLVWDPGGLPIERTNPVERAWLPDGPHLPVEFARHSSGNRITLVLVRHQRTLSVLWASMLVADLETAKRGLAIRECRKRDRTPVAEDTIQRFMDESCGSWIRKGNSRGRCVGLVEQWAAPRDVEAVIWTDLPARFNGNNGQVPTSDDVIEFLQHLEGQERRDAMDYIMKAPRQISTDYRRQIEEQLQWMPTSSV